MNKNKQVNHYKQETISIILTHPSPNPLACEQQMHFRSSLLSLRKIASANSSGKTIFRDVKPL